MRRGARWVLPLLLAGAMIGGAVVAVLGEQRARSSTEASTGAGGDLTTPVLSVRRVPSLVAQPVARRRLREDLAAWVAGQPTSTCVVVEGPGGATFEHQGDLPVVPASTQKLLTATAALTELDPAARFRTVVTGPAPMGGVVAGDLTLVGGGDPLLATAAYMSRFRRQPQVFTDLDALAAAVVGAGITRVEGAVVGDEGRFDSVRSVSTWPPRYVAQGQAGPLSALAVNDGFATYPTPAASSTPLTAAADPPAHAAGVLTDLLRARGVTVAGSPRRGSNPSGATELASVESRPIGEVVAQLLRESDNDTGELLVKELGRTTGEPSTPGGTAVVDASAGAAGADRTGAVVADGSGLSPANRVTCRGLVDLLTISPTAPTVVEALPVAGESGTLAERFVGTDLEGHLRAKTGSLATVTALAGVVDDPDGRLTFALVVNVGEPGQLTNEVVASQEALGELLLGWPRLPNPELLGPQ